MLSPFARALMAASALTSVASPPVDGSTTLNYSLLNPMLEATGGQFEVYHVTNLNTSGAGSLDDALRGGSSNVTRIVAFDVSGACAMPLVEGGQYHAQIYVSRSNLYVAGQTAPPGPNGRGFTLYGSLRLQHGSNIVIEHLVMSPRNNVLVDDIESGYQFLQVGGNGTENIVLRNMTIKNTNDASVVFTFDNALSNTGTRNIVVLNSMIVQPSQRSTAGDYFAAHAYSFMADPRSYRLLATGNLFTSGNWRSPWVATGSHVGWINNYFWDFGAPTSLSSANPRRGYPITLNIRGGNDQPEYMDKWYASDNAAPTSFSLQRPNYIILDAIGNLYEGGPTTKMPVNDQYFISPQSAEEFGPTASPQGPTDWGHYIHLAGNRVESIYNQATAFSNGIEIDSVLPKSSPEVVTGYDAPDTQPSGHITWRDTPRYAYPFTPMPWTNVRTHTLKYAGSHPADREPDDARIIAEITSRDHTHPDAFAPAPKDPVTTTVVAANVPVVGTSSTGTLTGSHPLVNGYDGGSITQLEQWLHELHMEALGIPDGAPDYDPNIAGAWIASTEEGAD